MKKVYLFLTMIVLISLVSSCAVDVNQNVSSPTPKKWGKLYD